MSPALYTTTNITATQRLYITNWQYTIGHHQGGIDFEITGWTNTIPNLTRGYVDIAYVDPTTTRHGTSYSQPARTSQ